MLSPRERSFFYTQFAAREYALDLGKAQFQPDIVEHIPVSQMSLATCSHGGKVFKLPSVLIDAKAVPGQNVVKTLSS